MSNNTGGRRKKVTRKMLRNRQLGALAVIAFIVLLFIVLIFRGCASSGDGKKAKKEEGTTTTTIATTTAAPVTTVVTTTVNPLAEQVDLSKREMFIEVGETDISYINSYPTGSLEENEVWESDNTAVATVDAYGHVMGVSPGDAIITLSFNNNPGIYIQIKVHVSGGSETSSPETETPTSGETDPAVVSFTTPVAMPAEENDDASAL